MMVRSRFVHEFANKLVAIYMLTYKMKKKRGMKLWYESFSQIVTLFLM